MMNHFLLCSLVFGIALTALTVAELCTPDQWQSMVSRKSAHLIDGHPGYTETVVSMSYDATNRRQAAYINTTVNKKEQDPVFWLVRYEGGVNNGTSYWYNLKTLKCSVEKLEKPFSKKCIPEDAVLVDNSHIGIPGAVNLGLQTHTYSIASTASLLTVTPLPGGRMFYVLERGEHLHDKKHSSMTDALYYQYTPGIKQPHIFDVPEACLKQDS